MSIESRFCTGLAPPVINDDWPETWEQTLYVWDEGDLQCLNCEKATIGEICLYCGMEIFTDDVMRQLLASSLKTASVDENGWHDSGEGPGSSEGQYIDWLTISNNAKSGVEDVRRIKHHRLVPTDIAVYGYIYEVETGRLVEVAGATEIGAAGT